MGGARWNYETDMLDESEPKILFPQAPSMHFVPVHTSKHFDYPHYRCPMYKTVDRRGVLATTGHSTNYVMPIRMPCDPGTENARPQAGDAFPSEYGRKWIKRGVALFCA